MTSSPFHDLDAYLTLPRTGSLTVSPDGTRAVVGVATLDKDATSFVTNLWQIALDGAAPVRLTRGTKGESTVAFTPGGDLLFVAKRPEGEEDAPAPLWLLPREGGEARVVATHPGGISGIKVQGNTALIQASLLPGSKDSDDDTERRKARKDKKVAAILHSAYPVRHWDHDLGPDLPWLYTADLSALTQAPAGQADPLLELRPLAGGRNLWESHVDLSPDASYAVVDWCEFGPGTDRRTTVARIDLADGSRTTLVAEDGADAYGAQISPDGGRIAYVVELRSTPEIAPRFRLETLDLGSGERTRLLGDWDNWPGSIHWLDNGEGLVMETMEDGRGPLYYVPAGGGDPVRLTGDGAYCDVAVLPGSEAVLAVRASYEYPSEVVRVDLTAGRAGKLSEPTLLRGPADRPALPGRLEEVETVAADGARVRSWLVLPEGASADNPAPLLLLVHGGPLMSWNAWSWRWNPWILAAHGYACLLPDPALSVGYGQEFVQRGWGKWGEAPFTDLMAATDAAVARPDIDSTRTAAMGGSFGGYMANWIAGHTDRFKAIVSHASLWALDQFGPTTDHSYYWERELSPEMALANSPHLAVGEIVTPMLVIHGDKDYRVPIGEGLRLWYELLSMSGLPAGEQGETAHRFLYFPNENHWVLSPQHAKVWYQVVLAFLSEHVLGEVVELPEVLG